MILVNGVKWVPLDEACSKINKKLYEVGNCLSVDDVRPFNGRLYVNEDVVYEMTYGLFA